VFKALGDETRLRVLELLMEGEQCACVLLEEVDIGQSTLSHHMKVLVNAGIVSARNEGKWTYYSIRPGGCGGARQLLEDLAAARPQERGGEGRRCC